MGYNCSKCNADMDEGFLLERGDGGLLSSTTWVAGAPEKAFLSGLRLSGKAIYTIKTFRCIECGYLDSYALTRQ